VALGCSGGVLSQRDDREQAHDAHDDESGLQQATDHVGESHAFALAPDDREQDGGGPDHRDRGHDLTAGAQEHLRIGARAHDVFRVVEHGVVERQRGDGRDGREHEEDPGEHAALSG
jgi:hypothetical protein